MKHWSRLGVLCALLVLFAFPAAAEKRVALVIGNNQYSALGPDEQLQKAVNDANAIGDSLEKIGFQVTRGTNLSRGEMLSELVTTADTLQPGDIAFFFYAGHGVSIDGANYLIPTDIPAANAGGENLIKFSAIPEAMVVETLKQRGVRVAVIVLDACRNNPFSRGGTRAFGDATRGLSRPPAVETQGVFGLYSAGFGEQALDRLGDGDLNPNSVFTRVLAPALSTPGMSLLDIAYKVNDEVSRLAATMRHDQNPAYYDQARARDVYLAGPPPKQEETPPVVVANVDREGKDVAAQPADSCAGAQLHFEAARELKSVEALQDHINRFGNCQFAALARLLIESMKPQQQEQTALPSDDHYTGADDPYASECERRASPAFDQMDTQLAINACTLAEQRNPSSGHVIYLLGRAYDAAKNNTDAVRWYREAADQGNADAQYSLALKYDAGDGVTLDDAEAVKWYRAAAEQGHASAQYYLGLMYDFGEGVTEDNAEAAKWYRASAEQGNAEAENRLALKYDYGEGVPLDDVEAVKWYRAAADQGLAAGQYNLGLMYDFGEGVPKDKGEAIRWIYQAAENGYADAQAKLGEKYATGDGVQQDYAESVKWYKKGVDQGNSAAQNGLALRYDNGQGVPLDDAEAVRLYRLAADQGLSVAQYNLALMYDNGEGVSKSSADAVTWYRKAADQGYAAAENMLGLKYDTGDGIALDDVEAVKWYRAAADQGHSSAEYNLGLMYDYGEGVQKDEYEACKWYRAAADQSHANAVWQLAKVYATGRCGTARDLNQAGQYFLKSLSLQSSEAQSELIDNRARSIDREARKEIQRALAAQGEYSGAIDGDFGSGTISALERHKSSGG